MSALVVNDGIVHYEVLGRGPGILFIHSWVGSWRYWVPTMQVLSARYRTYAIDLWGYGDSGKRSAQYTIDGQVELVLKFLDHLGVAKVAVVGHGLGAAVSVRLASRHPEFVARLMSIGLPMNASSINPRFSTSNVPALLDWLVGKGPDTDLIVAESGKIDPAVLEAMMREMSAADFGNELHTATAPTLLVHGEKDSTVAAPSTGPLRGGRMNLHRMSFEGGRHFPMLDDPPKFHRLVADFLEATDLTSLQLKDEWKRRMR